MVDKNNLTTLAKRLRPLLGSWVNNLAGQSVGEGPGIDIVKTGDLNTVGLGGDTILLYDSGGNPSAEYAASDAGLISALAAMGPWDVIELPDVTISGGPWTIINGTVRGHSMYGTILDGEVTVSASCRLEHISIIRSEAYAGTIYGAKLEDASILDNCYIYLVNSAGNAIGVYSVADISGMASSVDTQVYADGIVGYAYTTDGANIRVLGGSAWGSTSPVGV